MVLNRTGAAFIYGSATYTIGEWVIANAESEYEGLAGKITEIRDGADRETANDTPDIYCSFDEPEGMEAVAELEGRFTELYQHPMELEDICLDQVAMAPEMIAPLKDCFHPCGTLSGQCAGSGSGECKGCGLSAG